MIYWGGMCHPSILILCFERRIIMEEKIYRHIGSEHYNPIQVHPEYLAIMPPSGNKPTMASSMWGSPEGDEYYTWTDWCKENDYSNPNGPYFLFKLKPGKKVFVIDSRESFDEFVRLTKKDSSEITDPLWKIMAGVTPYYDFNKLYEMGYAGIEVLISKCSRLYHDLCGWDCDSICILDPDAVEEVI